MSSYTVHKPKKLCSIVMSGENSHQTVSQSVSQAVSQSVSQSVRQSVSKSVIVLTPGGGAIFEHVTYLLERLYYHVLTEIKVSVYTPVYVVIHADKKDR